MNELEGPAVSPSAETVLVVCTRDPRGRESGRKIVLNTIIDSLGALGFRVIVAHFGPPEDAPADAQRAGGAAAFHALPGPRRHELAQGNRLKVIGVVE